MHFLKHKSYTGVSTVVCYKSGGTILMNCKLHRLTLEILLKSQLQ